MRGGAVEVGDVVPDDRSVKIVGAGIEHELSHAERLHDPERLRMRNVVEHEPCDGEGPEVLEPRRTGKLFQSAAIREEGKRNDGLEVPGLEAGLSGHGKPMVRVGLRRSGERHLVRVCPGVEICWVGGPVREASHPAACVRGPCGRGVRDVPRRVRTTSSRWC